MVISAMLIGKKYGAASGTDADIESAFWAVTNGEGGSSCDSGIDYYWSSSCVRCPWGPKRHAVTWWPIERRYGTNTSTVIIVQ
jgi:hypothetical protein